MHKKLTAKTQKLAKKLPQETNAFSTTLVIEPDEQDLLEKKGSLYVLFDVTSKEVLDPLLITKVVNDVLHDSYYGSESASPMQSLERALVEVKDKVSHLPGSKSKDTGIIEFNILSAVLWGNVLYMVQFGKGGSFLVRDNQVKPVNTSTEGSFSVASGVIKDEDVVILGTSAFNQEYKAEDLISGNISISMHDLLDSAAALLLKFEMEAELTEEEKINFVGEEDFDEVKVKKDAKKTSLELAKALPKNLPKISIAKVSGPKFKPHHIAIILLGILLLGSIFWTIRKRNNPVEESVVDSALVVDEEQINESEEIDTSRDEELKILRIDPQAFYDIKLADDSSDPSEMVALDSELIVSDANSGKLFSSSLTTPKFEEITSFNGVSNLNYFGGDLTFIDQEGYKVYDKPVGDVGSVTESYSAAGLNAVAPYLAFIYSVEGDQIIKYELLDGELSGNTWAQSSDISDVRDIAIDGSIYLLKSNELMEFFGGEKTDFTINGIEQGLEGARKVIKTVDLENIYIADSGNNRILVVSEEGELINQYLATGDEFSDIRSIAVSLDESTLFILSGSRVYEISL